MLMVYKRVPQVKTLLQHLQNGRVILGLDERNVVKALSAELSIVTMVELQEIVTIITSTFVHNLIIFVELRCIRLKTF